MAKLEVAEGCLYNKGARARVKGSGYWSVFILVPTWVNSFMHNLGLNDILQRAILVALICLAVEGIRFLARSIGRKVRDFGLQIRERLEANHGCALTDSVHVGIAPGTNLVSYEGDYSWDVGFLSITDRVCYYGDQTAFSLTGNQIRKVRIVRPFETPLHPRLQIQFAIKTNDKEALHWLTIEERESRSVTSQYATLQGLRSQIYLMPRLALTPALGMPPVVPVQRWLTAGK